MTPLTSARRSPVRAARVAPAETPTARRVRRPPVLGAVQAQPVQRGIHVVELRGEARLAAQAVLARRDREAGGDDAVERVGIAEAGGEDLAAAAQPAASVQEDDERRAIGAGRPQIERQRTEPFGLREVDLVERRHGLVAELELGHELRPVLLSRGAHRGEVGHEDTLRRGRVGLLTDRMEETLEAGGSGAEDGCGVLDLERVHDARGHEREVPVARVVLEW